MRILCLVICLGLTFPLWSKTCQDSLQLPDLRNYLLESKIDSRYQLKTLAKQSGDEWYPAFFCRIEHLCERKTKIGSKFRLGSLEYVNHLEEK